MTSVDEGSGPGKKEKRKKGKARGERRDGSGNERITTGCTENMSLEITVITRSHIYNEIVSV